MLGGTVGALAENAAAARIGGDADDGPSFLPDHVGQGKVSAEKNRS